MIIYFFIILNKFYIKIELKNKNVNFFYPPFTFAFFSLENNEINNLN